jgi:dethiobiotin synthetase
LTVEALAQRGIDVAGVVIGSWPRDPTEIDRDNRGHLEQYGLLGAIPEHAGRLDPARFRRYAPTWWTPNSEVRR